MRALLNFFVDLVLFLAATALALLIRENFNPSYIHFSSVGPYFVATALIAAVILPLFRLNRTIWRLSSLHNYLWIVVAVLTIVACSLALTFSYNRLDGVSRTLPILQGIMAVWLLVGARVLLRLRHGLRQTRREKNTPLHIVAEQPGKTVLLVGLSQLTETYLRAVAELAPKQITVAGLLGHTERHIGRLVGKHQVLGIPEQIETIIDDLELHGIFIDRIVITRSLSTLSAPAREALLRIEKAGSIELQILTEILGFEPGAKAQDNQDLNLHLEVSAHDLTAFRRRYYWSIKRSLDSLLASLLVVCLSPLMVLIGLFSAASMGFPVVFWQQRPGLGGRPFRLYKFRTMAAPHDHQGRRRSDEERMSQFGTFLRRSRLDELPQLFNIILGEMSFIGPRPLLPCDQSISDRARLLVRPGLTGWAQVIGGRDISPEDKAVLDVWYVHNASLKLDFEIVLSTIPVVIYGEKINKAQIKRAWKDLRRCGTIRDDHEQHGDATSRAA